MELFRNKKVCLQLAISIASTLSMQAQNLCPNSGFENLSSCMAAPNGSNQIAVAFPWVSLSTGATADLFDSCYDNTLAAGPCEYVDVPVNFAGNTSAHGGTGYAGLVAYQSNLNYREYINAGLTSPLNAGTPYKIQCWVKRSPRSRYAIKEMGILLTNGLPVQGGNYTLSGLFQPQIKGNSVITDTSSWTLITGYLVPPVPLDYITIGNIYTDLATTKLDLGAIAVGASCLDNATDHVAYYYIDDVSITEIIEQLSVTGDTIICPGASTTLYAQANTATWWSTAALPNDTITTSTALSVAPTDTTTYILHGLANMISVTVYVVNPPIVNLGPDTVLCEGVKYTLSGGNQGSTYFWSTGETTQVISATDSGYYWVRVNNSGCIRGDSIYIARLFNPQVELGNDSLFCLNNYDSLQLDAGTGNSYLWMPTLDTTRYISAYEDGMYSVIVTQSNGCTTTDTAYAVEVCPPRIFVPKAFTPNGDLHNDIFIAYGSNILGIEMLVYNRWGQLVFAGANKAWDGKSSNEDSKQGVYIYKIVYFYVNETGTIVSENLTGWVALLR